MILQTLENGAINDTYKLAEIATKEATSLGIGNSGNGVISTLWGSARCPFDYSSGQATKKFNCDPKIP